MTQLDGLPCPSLPSNLCTLPPRTGCVSAVWRTPVPTLSIICHLWARPVAAALVCPFQSGSGHAAARLTSGG